MAWQMLILILYMLIYSPAASACCCFAAATVAFAFIFPLNRHLYMVQLHAICSAIIITASRSREFHLPTLGTHNKCAHGKDMHACVRARVRERLPAG